VIVLGALLLILYIFLRHPLILGAGVLLMILGVVLLVTQTHYAYY
jgi:hypothetical protein